MTFHLQIIAGPEAGKKFSLAEGGVLVIGRGSDSDTKIRDPRLSRVHCELKHSEGKFVLVDRGGVGGVSVNGRKIEDHSFISLGTVISIGDSQLRLEGDDGLDAATLGGVQSKPIPEVSSARQVDSSLKDLIGQTFQDRFRMDKIASTSPTSVVFQGFDLKHDREVAIKVLRPQMTSSDPQRERFIRAMKTVMPIKHPNIVRLRMAGQRGPYCWAATDWIVGVSVAELIESIGISGMLDWKQVWRVALHIGRALEEAQRHQVVHRNVIPANIIRRSQDKVFFLSDLIYARALEQTDAAQLTRPGEVLGDLGYMAPERIFDVENVDERSDQFGLGATLYALLTGKPPYAAETLPQLIAAFRGEKPPAPKTFQIGLNEQFSALVMKMIEINPSDRYSSATLLVLELERVGKLGGLKE
jgi:eukaryotic-like serine/threonine-protein kinase